MFIYHYHAIKQIQIGAMANMDGIAILTEPIVTMDDYQELKSAIAKDAKIDDVTGITICSLTLLQDNSNKSKDQTK